MNRRVLRRCLVAACLAILTLVTMPAGAAGLWSSRPYEVAIEIDAAPSGLSPSQRERLVSDVIERLQNRLPGFWRIRTTDEESPVDKRFDVGVKAGGDGYHIVVQEHDQTLDNDSEPTVTIAAEAADLSERVFCAIVSTFRPIATLTRDPNDSRRVTLDYRAFERAPSADIAAAAPGALLLPYQRKLDREGRVIDSQPTPWTYLIAEPIADGEEIAAKVISHTRRPFSARTGGRIEQLALAAPIDPQRRTRLRLHAHDNPATPLPGYEVSLGQPGESALTPLGYTDDDGAVLLPAKESVWMAHVRCGAIPVASIPVAPGIAEVINVPLVDERSRLRAELEVTSLREELIDTVARRKILGERIRRLAEAENFDGAKALLSEFDALPGMSDFTRRLDSVERSAKAPHPIAKARLDKLFSQTRNVVSSALDARESRELSILIDRAEQAAAAGSAKPSAQGG